MLRGSDIIGCCSAVLAVAASNGALQAAEGLRRGLAVPGVAVFSLRCRSGRG